VAEHDNGQAGEFDPDGGIDAGDIGQYAIPALCIGVMAEQRSTPSVAPVIVREDGKSLSGGGLTKPLVPSGMLTQSVQQLNDRFRCLFRQPPDDRNFAAVLSR